MEDVMDKKVWNEMTDSSCGEEALDPGGARVSVCCSNLSGEGVGGGVSHAEGRSEGCVWFCIMHIYSGTIYGLCMDACAKRVGLFL